jgi:hypothetical protein
MPNLDQAQDSRDAVQRFAADPALQGRAPERISARLDGGGGMARLVTVEAAIADLWPPTTAKELIWLTGSGGAGGDVLHLQARAADGALLHGAAFRLAG